MRIAAGQCRTAAGMMSATSMTIAIEMTVATSVRTGHSMGIPIAMNNLSTRRRPFTLTRSKDLASAYSSRLIFAKRILE